MARVAVPGRNPGAPPKLALNAGLTLFVEPLAPVSQWLNIVLAEKEIEGAHIERVDAGTASEDFLTLSPTGTLPVLADRTGIVTGAATIAEYVEERYPHPPLMPTGPVLRAQARMLMRQFEMVLFPELAALKLRAKVPPEACAQMLRDAATRFTGRSIPEGICGNGYTVVDCAMAVLLARLREAQIAVSTNSVGFARYIERALARPAVLQVFTP